MPIASRRLSASVSTRETKKLATDATLEGSPPASTSRSSPLRYASITSAWRSSEKISVMLIDLPFAIESSIAGRPAFVAGIFTNRFGRSTIWCRSSARSRVALGFVGEPRVDLERDVAVDAPGAFPHRTHQIARFLDVLDRELAEDQQRIVLPSVEHLAKLVVVRVARRERLLEDRRVRRDAGDGVLVHQPRELAVASISRDSESIQTLWPCSAS